MAIWAQAKDLAAQTPESRNRYVDLLRAVSILFVIVGHWLLTAVQYQNGELVTTNMLVTQPGMQGLTWLFQVMPVFFVVGGYANAVSLESASRRGDNYATWLAGRLHRLITPLLAVLLGWGILALALHYGGMSGAVIQAASRAALVPIWFLAIYVAIVVLAPVTHAAWKRWGFLSFFVLVGLAVLNDYAFFAWDLRWLGWSNYFFVWLSVHHIGFAWREDRLGGPLRLLLYSALAYGLLLLLVNKGPYPLAMVGSPDPKLSNSLPPKVTMLILGIFQFGLLLALERPMQRILAGVRVWAGTILINSMIMTLYLWHSTLAVIVIALLYLAGGFGLGLEPGTAAWWYTRPIWVLGLFLLLVPLALLLSVFERRGRPADAPVPAAWRQVSGAVMLGVGVALIGRFGFGNPPLPGLNIAAFILVFAGAGLSGLLPRLR